jgi:serine/threonine-protein kinase RsbT
MATLKNEFSETQDERQILVLEPADKEQAVIAARHLAAKAGLTVTDQFEFATAVSELATNILKYAKTGEISLKILQLGDRVGVEVSALDKGPGIADIDRAMEDNFSTSKKSLGLGLPSVRRLTDEFEIASTAGEGTRISARKWRRGA